MQSEIKITNNTEKCVIDIEGTIGVAEEWQFDEPSSRVATYDKFKSAIESIKALEASDVEVNIRSTGGDVNDAMLIYEALRQMNARITTVCYGYTASAATIIAQAASDGCRYISSSSLYLIHNSTCSTEGNAQSVSADVEMLRQTDARLAELYASRSGRTVEEFAALMSENSGNGRWLSPAEVVAAGLADKIIDAQGEIGVTGRVENVVRRILAAVGVGVAEPLPQDVNILHRNEEGEQPQSLVAMSERQKQAVPTATAPVEDPPCVDIASSPNAQAYADDLNKMRQRRFY